MAANKSSSTIRRIPPKRNPRGPTIKQRKSAYDRDNREWAKGILRNPEKHPPYAVTTARNVLMRVEEEQCPGPKQMSMPTTGD